MWERDIHGFWMEILICVYIWNWWVILQVFSGIRLEN